MPATIEKSKGSRMKAVTPSTLQDFEFSVLEFINRQRTRKLNGPLLSQITESALAKLPHVNRWDLTYYFVSAKRMAEINETHLGHAGATDVITLDYSDANASGYIVGEIFICVEIAVLQAREFRTTWQSEVVRYIVHALLHLCGHDDLKPAARRKMKTVENRLVRRLGRQFRFAALARPASRKRLGGPMPTR
jgi:rRNA maturation RNase YbeY